MTDVRSRKVIAIIVSYNPGPGELQALVSAASTQVHHLVVVDNGSREDIGQCFSPEQTANLTIIKLGENFGIATALNHGAVQARKLGASHVLFFDQDSVPDPDMVERLMAELDKIELSGLSVAAVGPCFLDPRANNPPPFIRVQGGRLVRMSRVGQQRSVEVDYLVTSGSLVPMASHDQVGPMEDELFIDYVDIEWGLRAKAKGFRLFGVYDAKMKHSLGNEPLQVFGLRLPVHSPLRHYYHFRNAVWMLRQSWVPVQWKWVNGYRMAGKFIVYSLLAPPRLEQFRAMVKGSWHGLVGRTGRLS